MEFFDFDAGFLHLLFRLSYLVISDGANEHDFSHYFEFRYQGDSRVYIFKSGSELCGMLAKNFIINRH